MEIEQLELRDLLPGVAGGKALRRLKGKEYFAELGRRGGITTRDRYGIEYLRDLAQRGGAATKRRYHELPRTVHPWYRGVERRILYWPPNATRQRKRPIYVKVEIEGPGYF